MTKYGVRDRTASATLSLAESSLLDTFLRTWIRGLTDATIKRKCAEQMCSPERSLRALYDLVESTRRINLEMQKLFEDEVKENELQFYKEIAQRNMPKWSQDNYVNHQLPQYQPPLYQAPPYQAPPYQAPLYQAPLYQAPSYQYEA